MHDASIARAGDRPGRRSPEKSGLDQQAHDGFAGWLVEPPQTRGLRHCQPEAGHLQELASNAFDHCMKFER
jgi:hypothetical protein